MSIQNVYEIFIGCIIECHSLVQKIAQFHDGGKKGGNSLKSYVPMAKV